MNDIPKSVQKKVDEFKSKDPRAKYWAILAGDRTWKILRDGVCCWILSLDVSQIKRSYDRNRLETRKSEAQCVKCGKPVFLGKSYCFECLKEQAWID